MLINDGKWNGFRMLALFLLIIFLLACNGDENCTNQSSCTAELLRESPGIWWQQGYGNALFLKGSTYQKYEYSSVHCLLDEEGPIKLFQDSIDHIQINPEKNQLTLKSKYTLTRFYFDKYDDLPQSCQSMSSGMNADPIYNFEVFWHTFNEQYAFFLARDVDWQHQYAVFRPQVNANTTDEELFEILSQMVMPLKDGHVNLNSPAQSFSVFNSKLFEQLKAEFESQSEIDDFQRYVYTVFEQFRVIVDSYLSSSRKYALNGLIRWGSLNERIAYLGIDSMAGFADIGESAAQLQVLNDALDQVMDEINDYEKIVIDLRINTGGLDQAAVAIANRFAHNSRLAFTKQAQFGNGYTPLQEVYLTPYDENQFLGPIVILTSGATSSAAENFLLAMQDRPDVVTIGQITPGIFSDTLAKKMPNGWEFSLSNEVFSSASGDTYEGIGLSPEIEVEVMGQLDRDLSIDSAIEYILSNL